MQLTQEAKKPYSTIISKSLGILPPLNFNFLIEVNNNGNFTNSNYRPAFFKLLVLKLDLCLSDDNGGEALPGDPTKITNKSKKKKITYKLTEEVAKSMEDLESKSNKKRLSFIANLQAVNNIDMEDDFLNHVRLSASDCLKFHMIDKYTEDCKQS